MNREHIAGIASRRGLDGLGIESRWGARFFAHVRTGLVAHSVSYSMDTGSLLQRLKRPGRGVHPPHLEPRLKKE
jgi:hypothetical protein